jgi:hypothetical protein
VTETAPRAYSWSVGLAGHGTSFLVEAAYPVIDDKGHMLLKDSEHKIVFAAEPGTGCTFTRRALASASSGAAVAWAHVPDGPVDCYGAAVKLPGGCTYTYRGNWPGPD